MAARLRLERLTGEALQARLDDVARLRCEVFREWPYLYDGDPGYERAYLAKLAEADGLVVAALEGDRAVGVSTAMPLAQADEAFRQPFERAAAFDVDAYYYLAESVLLPERRGQGIGVRFFEEREAVVRERGFMRTCFCAVVRRENHPARPDGYEPLDAFWRRRGYAPLEGMTATFDWREVGAGEETDHIMQFWSREL